VIEMQSFTLQLFFVKSRHPTSTVFQDYAVESQKWYDAFKISDVLRCGGRMGELDKASLGEGTL
jgi:hypothetical protein